MKVDLLSQRGHVTSTIVGMGRRSGNVRPLTLDDVRHIHAQVREFGHPLTVLRVRFESGDVIDIPAAQDRAAFGGEQLL